MSDNMTTPLWNDSKVREELDNNVERQIVYADALASMFEMRQSYETERATLQEKIINFNTQVNDQNNQIADLESQVENLTEQITVLNTQIVDLQNQPPTQNPTADITVTVGSTVKMTSIFETAMTHVASQDLLSANATAKTKGMKNLGAAITYFQKQILGWGALDPWLWNGVGTRPPEPTNWASLDNFLKMSLDMGGKLAINTQLWPWHLRGKWNADGTTTPCVASEQFSDSGVIMTSEVSNYLLLIQRLAERYLVAPYNVRIWTTGTEYHGLYQGRDKTFKEWRWDDYPGTPGRNADMGASYIHNITVDKITEVAIAKSIDLASLVFVNNYPPISATAKPTSDSVPVGHPLRGKAWGTAIKQGISIMANMPPLLKRVDILGFDMASVNKDGVALVDDFASLNRYDDIISYIKTVAPSRPLAIMETYDKPQADPGPNTALYRAAIRADAFRHMLLNGVWAAFVWGNAGEAMNYGSEAPIPDAALLTDTSVATGGQSTAMLDVVKMYHDSFGPGTPIYDAVVVGSGVAVLPSDKYVILINQTNSAHHVAVGQDVYMLNPYQVRKVAR